MRSLIVLGVVLCALGVVLLAVVWFGPLAGRTSLGQAWYDSFLVPAGVFGAGLSLAAGLALIGVGMGRWRRPLPTGRSTPHDPLER